MPTISETKKLFIDIETSISPDYELFKPTFKAPRITQKGEPDKRDATIEEQETVWKSKLALSPLTGQILMFGFDLYRDVTYERGVFFQADNCMCIQETRVIDERVLILQIIEHINATDLIIGHNIKEFDLPFIINRCKKHGIKPPDVGRMIKGRWYWDETIVDTMDLWACGKYKEMVSLNNLAKYFGLEPKEETIAKNFEQVFNDDLEKAIEYCKTDIELTKQIYEKLK